MSRGNYYSSQLISQIGQQNPPKKIVYMFGNYSSLSKDFSSTLSVFEFLCELEISI